MRKTGPDTKKTIASVFKTRIELRQIGVRDEAKLMGGIGNCGRGLCCKEWMPDFQPVSIKMAKTQNLSLNPTKISGMCGRLMCCLKFENDIYQELGKGMPGIGERIETPEGLAVVMDVNILVDKIKCRLIQTETNAEGDEYEKLDNEILVYSKEEITRQDKRRGKGLQQAPKKQQPAKQKKKEEETEQEEAVRRNRKTASVPRATVRAAAGKRAKKAERTKTSSPKTARPKVQRKPRRRTVRAANAAVTEAAGASRRKARRRSPENNRWQRRNASMTWDLAVCH